MRDVRTTRPRWSAFILTAGLLAACSGGDDGSSVTNTTVTNTTVTSTTVTSTTVTNTTVTNTTVDPVAAALAGRPYEVERLDLTLVDDSRTTPTRDGEPVPSRTLETLVMLPVTDKPVPLIIFSHGYSGHPEKFERLLTSWAAAGYATAAPMFPLTNDDIPDTARDAGDVVNQPGDVSFVLDQLLAGDLADRFDTERLGAAGLSLGGLTTYLAGVDVAGRDPRFRAAIVMAAVPPSGDVALADVPVLVMHGELDPVMPLGTATAMFDRLIGPTHFVTLFGALHAEAFEDDDPDDIFTEAARYHPVVDATTIAFWDTYLLADPAATARIAAAADVEGLSTIRSH